MSNPPVPPEGFNSWMQYWAKYQQSLPSQGRVAASPNIPFGMPVEDVKRRVLVEVSFSLFTPSEVEALLQGLVYNTRLKTEQALAIKAKLLRLQEATPDEKTGEAPLVNQKDGHRHPLPGPGPVLSSQP